MISKALFLELATLYISGDEPNILQDFASLRILLTKFSFTQNLLQKLSDQF